MPKIPLNLKRKIARAVRWWPMHQLMRLAIHLLVAQHRVGVAVVTLNERGQVLLLHHVFHPYVPWGLPGGWLGRRELPEDCAIRELEEETGLQVELGPVLSVVREADPPHLTIIYLAEVRSAPMELSAEVISAEWFAPDELPSPLFPYTREAIERAVSLREKQLA